MPATYTAIATSVLSSASGSITFSGIPQTYTDLVLVIQGAASTDITIRLRFNGDTTSSYNRTYFGSYNGGNSSGSDGGATSFYASDPGTAFGTNNAATILHIQNYTSSAYHKSMLMLTTGQDTYQSVGNFISGGIWANIAAITTMQIFIAGGYTFNAGTVLALYGIKAA